MAVTITIDSIKDDLGEPIQNGQVPCGGFRVHFTIGNLPAHASVYAVHAAFKPANEMPGNPNVIAENANTGWPDEENFPGDPSKWVVILNNTVEQTQQHQLRIWPQLLIVDGNQSQNLTALGCG